MLDFKNIMPGRVRRGTKTRILLQRPLQQVWSVFFFLLKSSNLNITCSLGYNVEETNPVHDIENKKDTREQNEKHQVQSCRFHLIVSNFFICFFPFSLSICGYYQL